LTATKVIGLLADMADLKSAAEPELSLEAKAAVRSYLVKLSALPVIAAAIVGFCIRSELHQAHESAYSQAYKEAISGVMRLHEEALKSNERIKRAEADSELAASLATNACQKALSLATNALNDANNSILRANASVASAKQTMDNSETLLRAIDKYLTDDLVSGTNGTVSIADRLKRKNDLLENLRKPAFKFQRLDGREGLAPENGLLFLSSFDPTHPRIVCLDQNGNQSPFRDSPVTEHGSTMIPVEKNQKWRVEGITENYSLYFISVAPESAKP
jgi:hypothetical protein